MAPKRNEPRVTAEQLLAHDWPLALARCPNEEDGYFDGSCPCAMLRGDKFQVQTRCWRVASGHSEIHVSGALPKATLRRIAEHIRDNNGWTDATEWRIRIQHDRDTRK